MFRLTRERIIEDRTEIVYGITSLSREQAGASRLLALVRRHWAVENGLHHLRDLTFGEDACRVRSQSAPEVLAGIRNAALHILKRVNPKNIAGAMWHLAAKPFKAIRLIKPKGKN